MKPTDHKFVILSLRYKLILWGDWTRIQTGSFQQVFLFIVDYHNGELKTTTWEINLLCNDERQPVSPQIQRTLNECWTLMQLMNRIVGFLVSTVAYTWVLCCVSCDLLQHNVTYFIIQYMCVCVFWSSSKLNISRPWRSLFFLYILFLCSFIAWWKIRKSKICWDQDRIFAGTLLIFISELCRTHQTIIQPAPTSQERHGSNDPWSVISSTWWPRLLYSDRREIKGCELLMNLICCGLLNYASLNDDIKLQISSSSWCN